jgi:hypothetical protein
VLAAFAGVLDAAFIGYADGSFGTTKRSGSNFDAICNQTMSCEKNNKLDRLPQFCGSQAQDSRKADRFQIFSR